MNEVLDRTPPGERGRMMAALNDKDIVVASHPNPEVAALLSRIYFIRTLDGGASQLQNSREAASGLRSTVVVALGTAADAFGDSRAIIFRRAGLPRTNIILLRPDVRPRDVGIALGALQSLRRLQGDILTASARVSVDNDERSEPRDSLSSQYRELLARLRSAPLRNYPEVGVRSAIDVDLPKVKAAAQ